MDKALTSTVTVKADPRVPATRVDLEALLLAQTKLAATLSKSSEASLEAHSIREQLQKIDAGSKPELKDALASFEKELGGLLSGSRTPAGVEERPGLDGLAGEAGGLYGEVGGADAAPTAALNKAVEHTGEEAAEVLRGWDQFKSKSLTAMNSKLRAAGLPAINLQEKPLDMPDSGDED